MKKFYLLIITVLLFIPLYCHAIVEKSENVFVTDEANLLESDSEDYIVKYSNFLYKNKGIDFYVVTIKSLEGEELELYTNQVFDQFDISNKGLIILVSKEDRKLRIQVGDKLLDTIDTPLIDDYINTYFMPYLEREEWNEGIVNGYSALYKYICEEYGLDATSMEVLDKLDFLTKYKTILMMLIIWSVAGFTKIYSYYSDKMKSNGGKKLSDGDLFLLVVVLLGNIFVVSISYVLKPIFLFFVIAFEGYFLYISLPSNRSKKRKKEKTISSKTEKRELRQKRNRR
ncbi:MAG: TPM domain-containing protein [Bacilli bacterium]|nr:TPM domain-containing protein [Bacilli bacterium]